MILIAASIRRSIRCSVVASQILAGINHRTETTAGLQLDLLTFLTSLRQIDTHHGLSPERIWQASHLCGFSPWTFGTQGSAALFCVGRRIARTSHHHSREIGRQTRMSLSSGEDYIPRKFNCNRWIRKIARSALQRSSELKYLNPRIWRILQKHGG